MIKAHFTPATQEMKEINFQATDAELKIATSILNLKSLADQRAYQETAIRLNCEVLGLESETFLQNYRDRRKELELDLVKELFPIKAI